MMMALAGAMSTAELGRSLAEMIRQGKVHAICCTGANLEEDVFNLVAHAHYERLPHYRDLTPAGRAGAARARTSTASPTPASPRTRRCGASSTPCSRTGSAPTPAASGCSRTSFSTAPAIRQARRSTTRSTRRTAGCWRPPKQNLPIFVPGWEDSTLGNIFAAHCIQGTFKNVHTVRSGIEYMIALADWYRTTSASRSIGLLPDRRRHRGRLPDLRRADAAARTCAWTTCRSGATSARSATRRRATARTPAPSRTRRSPGASSASTRRSSSSSRTRPSSRR